MASSFRRGGGSQPGCHRRPRKLFHVLRRSVDLSRCRTTRHCATRSVPAGHCV